MDNKSKQIDPRIHQITTMVAGDFNLNEVLEKLSQTAVEITDTDACSIRLLDKEAGELQLCASYGLSDSYRAKGQVSKNDTVIKAAFEGQAIVLDDMRADARVKYRKAARKEGLVSQLTVVMEFKKQPIGVLRLYHKKLHPFYEEDIAIARLVASQCAVAIENARLYSEAIEGARISSQMRLAGVIQRRMIPNDPPGIKKLDILGIYQPCFDVGGDLYDIIKIDDSSCLIVIADVIGKGIPAALMMSMFRGAIRAYSHGGHNRHTLEEIVAELNHTACNECRDGEFITMFVAKVDTKNMKITYCNCGHEPALLFRNKEVTELADGGMVLGVLRDTEYKSTVMDLEKKDMVLFYTDGLIDAINFEGDSWGRDEMLEVAEKHIDGSSERLVKNILRYRRRFVGLARQVDDTTLVAIKVKSPLVKKTVSKVKNIAKAVKKKSKLKARKQNSQ